MKRIAEIRAPCAGGLFFWSLVVAVLLVSTYVIYSLGFSFGYSFDEESHLSGLDQVTDLASALYYVFDGHAGPLGRPLSLATFLFQISSWPSAPADFVRANTLLHLTNSLLVIWLSFRLAPYITLKSARPEWFALAVGALWMSSPLLLSTSMMIIQRMASLSATFVFLGLIAFVEGREMLPLRKWRGIALMSVGVGGGTLLAALSKENGVLLPLLALCMERILLRHGRCGLPDSKVSLPVWWQAVFLFLPVAAIFWIVINTTLSGGHYPGREFDMRERLLTESRVLFQYLKLLIVPVRSEIGPFQDFELSQGLLQPASTSLAIAAWLLLFTVSWRLRRTQWRFLSFGLCWFLVGHLLESSVFGLEIYFEHRNYLPAFGIHFAIVASLATVPIQAWARGAILGTLILNHVFVLKECGLLWRDPVLAGELWHKENPGSLRALQLHAYGLGQQGRLDEVVQLIDAAPERLQDTIEFQLYRLDVFCNIVPEEVFREAVSSALEKLKARPVDAAAAMQVARLSERRAAGSCDGFRAEDAMEMFQIIASAGDRASAKAVAGANYHLAKLWMNERSLDRTMEHLQRGFALDPQLASAIVMVNVLLSAGLVDEAESRIDLLRRVVPKRPFVKNHWNVALDELEAAIDSAKERPVN